MSNNVQLIFDKLPSALEQARSVRALGVTSPQRWPGVPDIPAIAETVPGFEAVGFYGISAPRGHAARDRRNPQQGDRRGAAESETRGAALAHRRPAEADDAGRIRSPDRERNRNTAQTGGIRQRFGRLTAAAA